MQSNLIPLYLLVSSNVEGWFDVSACFSLQLGSQSQPSYAEHQPLVILVYLLAALI